MINSFMIIILLLIINLFRIISMMMFLNRRRRDPRDEIRSRRSWKTYVKSNSNTITNSMIITINFKFREEDFVLVSFIKGSVFIKV